MLYFTSDTHLGHGNILKYCNRPGLSAFEMSLLQEERYYQSLLKKDKYQLSVEEKRILNSPEPYCKVSRESIERMDDYLIDEINSLVGENDTLFHLGDFCFAQKYEYFHIATKYRNRIKCRNVHLIWGNHDHHNIHSLFNSTYDLHSIKENGQSIILCHYAMAVWEKSHRGCWQLYGHSHSSAENWMDEHFPNRRSMDVGVDNIFKLFGKYRPISFVEIQKIMNNRTGCSIDHHN